MVWIWFRSVKMLKEKVIQYYSSIIILFVWFPSLLLQNIADSIRLFYIAYIEDFFSINQSAAFNYNLSSSPFNYPAMSNVHKLGINAY